jgi:cellulose synthase/poly-beta-1,6-N-acetylglucosamine synthase-like glycosyltransferase
MTLIIITSVFLFAYSLLMLYYKIQWDVSEEMVLDKKFKPHFFVSIIIAARNEEKNIEALIKSLLAQDYPAKKYEVIIVDDYSEDRTAEIITSFAQIKYIHASECEKATENSFKKSALELGIKNAQGDVIITSDADCVMCERWLSAMIQNYEQGDKKMLAGPVAFTKSKGWFQIFQGLDFMSMQGVTAAVLESGKGVMCNGANLLYEKSVFREVNGFEGIDKQASGDDMMLMKKVERAYPNSLAYVKCRDAIVFTDAMPTLSSFLQQRIRWASKNKSLNDSKIKWVLAFVFFVNVSLLATILLLLAQPTFWFYVLILLIIKGIVEYFFVKDIAHFFDRKDYLPYLFLLQPLHIFYMVFVAILGLFSTYQWKGRRVH